MAKFYDVRLYIVEATDEFGKHEYEYGCFEHAQERYNKEENARFLMYLGEEVYVKVTEKKGGA